MYLFFIIICQLQELSQTFNFTITKPIHKKWEKLNTEYYRPVFNKYSKHFISVSELSIVSIILSSDVFNIVVKDLTVLFVIAPNLGLLPFALMSYNSLCAYIQLPFVSPPCLFFPTFCILTANLNQGMEKMCHGIKFVIYIYIVTYSFPVFISQVVFELSSHACDYQSIFKLECRGITVISFTDYMNT